MSCGRWQVDMWIYVKVKTDSARFILISQPNVAGKFPEIWRVCVLGCYGCRRNRIPNYRHLFHSLKWFNTWILSDLSDEICHWLWPWYTDKFGVKGDFVLLRSLCSNLCKYWRRVRRQSCQRVVIWYLIRFVLKKKLMLLSPSASIFYLPSSSVSSVVMVLYIIKLFFAHPYFTWSLTEFDCRRKRLTIATFNLIKR